MAHVHDMIVLGGGPAGYTAALYAARAGLDVLILERMMPGGQMTQTEKIDNYPGFDGGIDGIELGMRMQAGAERFGAKTEYADVAEVRLGEPIKRFLTAGGEYLAKTAVIATGANPRKLAASGEDALLGRGVHYCAHCDGRFYKGKDVTVVGGGNSAAADALYLSRLAKSVTLVHRRDTLRAEKLARESLLRAENVRFLWNSTVKALKREESGVSVTLEEGSGKEVRILQTDGVFVSIGRRPATELFRDSLLLDGEGYIVADETTKTNLPGVYAVGDVRTKLLRQVVTAVGDGAVAAHLAEEYIAAL